MKKYPIIFGQNFGIPAIVHQQGCITAFFLELVRSAVISESLIWFKIKNKKYRNESVFKGK